MRNRTLAALLILSSLSAPALSAEGQSKLSLLKTWFAHLKQGLSESAVAGHYQKTNVTAVAAVRGAGQDAVDPDKPAWKSGKSKREDSMKAERADFAKAVDLILQGKASEGLKGLDSFEKSYPKSALLPQVQEAREKVKELEAASGEPAGEAPETE